MYDYRPMSYEQRHAFIEQAMLDAHRARAQFVAAPFRALFGFVKNSLRHVA